MSQGSITTFRTERQLQMDLAEHLREAGYLTFTEIELPSTGGRMDVAAIKPHQYTNACLKGYEVKLTRSVFLGDVQAMKYQKYMNTVNQLYFAAPQGVISKDDLPPDTGLIVRTATGWHVQKAPRILRAEKLGRNDLLAMLFRGYEGDKEGRRLAERIRTEDNLRLEERALGIGHQIASRLKRTKESRIEKWAAEFNVMLLEVFGEVRIDSWDADMPSIWEVRNILQVCTAYRAHAEKAARILAALARTMNGGKDEISGLEEIL